MTIQNTLLTTFPDLMAVRLLFTSDTLYFYINPGKTSVSYPKLKGGKLHSLPVTSEILVINPTYQLEILLPGRCNPYEMREERVVLHHFPHANLA